MQKPYESRRDVLASDLYWLAATECLTDQLLIPGQPIIWNLDLYIQWLPNGEAFRVLDVERLESETLPKFFRHSKFQVGCACDL